MQRRHSRAFFPVLVGTDSPWQNLQGQSDEEVNRVPLSVHSEVH